MEDTQNSADAKHVAVPVNSVVSAVSATPLATSIDDPKDQNLDINKGEAKKPASDAPKADSTEEVMIHRPDDVTQEDKVGDPSGSKPLTVSEEEVDEVREPMDLANKIEILAGEIQTLEARIDRLASSATPLSHYSNLQSSSSNTPPQAQEPASPTPIPAPTPAPESANPATTDIYATNEIKGRQAEVEAKKGEDAEERSIAGGIGSLLVSLGIVILVVILALPLIKEMIGKDIFAMSQGVGWPVVLGLLGIGGVVLLFSVGRMVIKILALLFLLIAALMYLGVLGYDSFLGPLSSSAAAIFSFYR